MTGRGNNFSDGSAIRYPNRDLIHQDKANILNVPNETMSPVEDHVEASEKSWGARSRKIGKRKRERTYVKKTRA